MEQASGCGLVEFAWRVELMSKHIAIGLMLAAFAAGVVVAQQDGLLQPQMDPTGGWTASGTMGKGGGWTATTVAAGVAQSAHHDEGE